MRRFDCTLLFLMVFICIPLRATVSKTLTKSVISIFYQEQQPKQPSKTSKDPFINQLNSKTERHNAHNSIEKVFLHTDKNMFSTGETIWYSAYVVIGPLHQYTEGSKVVHVDLVGPNGQIAVAQTHALTKGKASGALEIPKNLQEGGYQLRAYTQWMRNYEADFFFTQELNILNKQNRPEASKAFVDDIDLQFFPEGGHMVADIAGKVSYKAIGSDGRPRTVSGKILNSEGATVATLSTFDRGSGFFQLTPSKGERYTAALDDGKHYPLPEIVDVGYTIAVNNLDQKSIKVFVQASEELRAKPFYVVGHMRQKNYFNNKFKFEREPMLKFEVPKAELLGGVLTLTLFDLNNKPWCERPIFISQKEELVINTKVNTDKFTKRGRVILDIQVTDLKGQPITTKLSLATSDPGQVEKNQGSSNILTQLLLESDIKGTVTDPGLLFQDQRRETLQKLDLTMLTHGWRKFDWPEVWNDAKPKKEFVFAQGITISGKALNTKEQAIPNATLNIMAKAGEKLGMFSAKTGLDGRFSIPNFNFNGSTKVVFNAFDYEDKTMNLKVKLDPRNIKVPLSGFNSPFLKQNEELEDYSNHSVARSRMEALYESNRVIKLDEVVVLEEKKEKIPLQRPSALGQEPDAALYTKDHIAMQTVEQLIQLFNGVTFTGNSFSVRGSVTKGDPFIRKGGPLFVLDGIPRDDLANQIQYMSTLDVERVELLKGYRAGIWGARGGNGVILIYTKRGEGQTSDPVLSPDFTILGHTAEKEFYSPKYDVQKEERRTPDYRATLYWNPNIITDEKGTAKIEFFNTDSAKEIQVSIEGLSDDGLPGTYLKTFGTKSAPLR